MEPTASRSMPRRSNTFSRSKARQPSSTASETQNAAAKGVSSEEENELPITFAVPSRCQAISKQTGKKVKAPDVYKVKQLAGRVDSICKEFDLDLDPDEDI